MPHACFPVSWASFPLSMPKYAVESEKSKCLELSWCAQAVSAFIFHPHELNILIHIKFLHAKVLRAVTEEMLENSLMDVFNPVLSQFVTIKYKGEVAVKRCEVQVLFFYHWLFLLYISLLFVVCLRYLHLLLAVIELFCFLDKILFSTNIPTKNHRATWSAMSDTPFIFVLS